MRVKKQNQKGFSLIELMIVVGIIGVLATMAVPKFAQFQAKAKQTEAKTTLNHIYTLQEAYFIDFNKYSEGAETYGATTDNSVDSNANCATRPDWATAMGLNITPCDGAKPLYGYNVTVTTGFPATATTGVDEGNKVFPSCATADVWQMSSEHALTNTTPGATSCL